MYKNPWSELAGAAETLLATDGLSVQEEVRQYRIQLQYVIPRTPWLTPFVLFKKDCMSANRTNVKRGRRASQAARKPNKP